MLFAEGPPPTEARQSSENKVRIALLFELLDKIQYRIQRFLRAPIVRADADVTAELKHGRFLVRLEAGLLEDHHPFGFAEDVVVEGAFRDAVFGRRLSEAHLLGHHSLDRLLEIMSRPRGCLQLQQVRIVS